MGRRSRFQGRVALLLAIGDVAVHLAASSQVVDGPEDVGQRHPLTKSSLQQLDELLGPGLTARLRRWSSDRGLCTCRGYRSDARDSFRVAVDTLVVWIKRNVRVSGDSFAVAANNVKKERLGPRKAGRRESRRGTLDTSGGFPLASPVSRLRKPVTDNSN